MKRRPRRVKPGIKHIARHPEWAYPLYTAWCGASKVDTPGTLIILAARFATCPECREKRAAHIERANGKAA